MSEIQIQTQIQKDLSSINDKIFKIVRKIKRTYRYYKRQCNIEYHALLCPNYCFSCHKKGKIELLVEDLMFVKATFDVIDAIISNKFVDLYKSWHHGFGPDGFIEVDTKAGVCTEIIDAVKQKLEEISEYADAGFLSKSARKEIERLTKKAEKILDKITSKHKCMPHTTEHILFDLKYKSEYENEFLAYIDS